MITEEQKQELIVIGFIPDNEDAFNLFTYKGENFKIILTVGWNYEVRAEKSNIDLEEVEKILNKVMNIYHNY